MAETPKTLYWVGERLPDGRPVTHLPGIPARDLNDHDLRRLSADQIAAATDSKLYQKTKPASRDEPKPRPRHSAEPDPEPAGQPGESEG